MFVKKYAQFYGNTEEGCWHQTRDSERKSLEKMMPELNLETQIRVSFHIYIEREDIFETSVTLAYFAVIFKHQKKYRLLKDRKLLAWGIGRKGVGEERRADVGMAGSIRSWGPCCQGEKLELTKENGEPIQYLWELSEKGEFRTALDLGNRWCHFPRRAEMGDEMLRFDSNRLHLRSPRNRQPKGQAFGLRR